MMQPLVSILVPAYNAQQWIAETLNSAVAQTWERKEIIVVDDGSTDQTLAIAKQFEAKGVNVVTQSNQGAAASRNKAFSLSRGDYIQWLDADDLLAPDKIERQLVSTTDRSSTTLLSSSFGNFMYRASKARFRPSDLWCDLSPCDWLIRKMGQNLYMQTSTWLVPRQMTEAAGPWNTNLLGDDDGEYFCRVLLKSDGVRFVSEAKVFYRVANSASLSYIGRSDSKMEAQWRSMKLHIGYLRSLEDSERTRKASVQYLQNWLINFYPQRPDLVTEMEQTAEQLGGSLTMPRLSWKYAWIETAFGRSLAAKARVALPKARWSLSARLDKFLFGLESKKLRGSFGK